MIEPTRLFDCMELRLANTPSKVMFAAKENETWKEYTSQDVAEIVNKLSAGLLNSGITHGDNSAEGRDKIAVISKNRPEWLMLDLAVQQIGAVLIPVYPTISVSELEFILNDAAVKLVFVSDKDLFKKVDEMRRGLPQLQEVYTFDLENGIRNWKEILSLSNDALIKEVKSISGKIQYEDLATIIYTSGTTGKPKGVMLSHKNILSNVIDSMPCFPPGEDMKALSFLPLNHIFERMVSYIYLFKGVSIYYAESFESIGDNLREVRPQMFTTVPRLLEKVYDKIMDKGKELTGIKRTLFFWAHNLATKFEINKNQGALFNLQLALANKLIFNKWREALGNEIKCIVSGGAACQVRLIRIFTAAKIIVMEGYGLTETSPVISVNRYQEDGRMFGTVGPLIRNVQVKIAPDGEILCKGPNVMMGYYKRPDLTAETMDDGWFKTGDIGMMIDDNFLKITDRKKEMFKTSGGKYVAPVAVENKLKESPYIENLMVTGAEQKYVGALITPAFDALKKWCAQKNISGATNEELIKNEQVQDLYKNEVEHFNKEFNHVEQIKRFELLPNEWSVETGEMTPKLSLKRKVIMEKYKEAVSRIYN
ncbi:MAG: long-chain fatty acid--CoA ligase [Ginsengibacter sp.]